MRIVAKDLTYVYGEKSKNLAVKALDNVSLTIEEGEFFGIIGQTGSGKSTFVQHLNGLIRVGKKKGSLTVGEFDLASKKCDFRSLRAKLGMVFQYPEYQLFAETVADDVAFGLKNFDKNLSAQQREERVRQAIEIVGLDYQKIKDKSPFELSGGQKRRVAIAGVIVTRPEVLVLDEPAAGLDPVGKKELMRILHSLHQNGVVKTVIIVSHDMDEVCENCNQIDVFSKGTVVLSGTPKEVFKNSKLLSDLRLDVPITRRLQEDLEKVGVKIDIDFTREDFIEKIVDYYKNNK